MKRKNKGTRELGRWVGVFLVGWFAWGVTGGNDVEAQLLPKPPSSRPNTSAGNSKPSLNPTTRKSVKAPNSSGRWNPPTQGRAWRQPHGKAPQGATFSWYVKRWNGGVQVRFQRAASLRKGLHGVFQAKTSSGRVLGVEAFSRWGNRFVYRSNVSELGEDLLLVLPRGARLDLYVMNGNVQVLPGASEVNVQALRGNIVVQGVAGWVKARTLSGMLTVRRCRGVRASAVSGQIFLHDIGQSAQVQNVSGSIFARRVRGKQLQVQAVQGRIQLAKIAVRSLKVSTFSGGIRLMGGLPEKAQASLRTYSGDVTLRWPKKQPLQLKSIVVSGAIVVNGKAMGALLWKSLLFPVDGRFPAWVWIKTISGNISVVSN